jgi:putative polyhydroxyalkanoate system protein
VSTISVTRPHSLSPSEAREKAESIARRFEDRLEVSWHWDGDALHLTADRGRARGASGQVLIGERVIDITIHLPFHLRPLRAFLHTELMRRLETLLGPVPSY